MSQGKKRYETGVACHCNVNASAFARNKNRYDSSDFSANCIEQMKQRRDMECSFEELAHEVITKLGTGRWVHQARSIIRLAG